MTNVSGDESLDERDSPASQVKMHKKVKKSVKNLGVAVEKDSFVKSHCGHGDTTDQRGLVEEAAGQGVQLQILAELRSMSARLKAVERQVGKQKSVDSKTKTKGQKLSSCTKSKKFVKQSDTSSSESNESLESSDDEIKIPELSYVLSSKDVQRQIDKSIAKLSRKQLQGNDMSQKLKSKRGGSRGGRCAKEDGLAT